MGYATLLFIVYAVVLGASIFFSMKQKRSVLNRSLLVALYLLCIPLVYYSATQMLGRPTQISSFDALLGPRSLMIKSFFFEEEKAIWLIVKDKLSHPDSPPIYVELPWDQKTIEALVQNRSANSGSLEDMELVIGEEDDGQKRDGGNNARETGKPKVKHAAPVTDTRRNPKAPPAGEAQVTIGKGQVTQTPVPQSSPFTEGYQGGF